MDSLLSEVHPSRCCMDCTGVGRDHGDLSSRTEPELIVGVGHQRSESPVVSETYLFCSIPELFSFSYLCNYLS